MDGSTVPLVEKPSQDVIKGQADALVDVFYHGDPMSDYEQDLETMYMGKKMKKSQMFTKRKSLRYKVRFTYSDVNRIQG